MRDHDQVLCIVNNRRHAQALFESIEDETGARHLTTMMHAKHRTRVLGEVRQRLKDKKPCRLVSTSLIEAGVDVDFPHVLRAEAGIDSIAQAAGAAIAKASGHATIASSPCSPLQIPTGSRLRNSRHSPTERAKCGESTVTILFACRDRAVFRRRVLAERPRRTGRAQPARLIEDDREAFAFERMEKTFA